MNHFVRLVDSLGTLLVDVHAREALPTPGGSVAMAGTDYGLSADAPTVKIERVDLGGYRAVEVRTYKVVRTGAAPLPPATIHDPSKPVRMRPTRLSRKRMPKVSPQPMTETAPAPVPEPQPDEPMRVADLPADAVVARFRDVKSREWVGPTIALRRSLQVGESVRVLGAVFSVVAFDGGSLFDWGGRRFDLKTVWISAQRAPVKQVSFEYP